MANFSNRFVYLKYTTQREHACGKIHIALQHSRPAENIEGCAKCFDQMDHCKKQNYPEHHGDNDALKPHGFLMEHGRPLAFDRDIKKIFKAKHDL